MGLPVIIILGSLTFAEIASQFYNPQFYPAPPASYFQPYHSSPFSDARHIRPSRHNNHPVEVHQSPVVPIFNRKRSPVDRKDSGNNDSSGRLLSSSAFHKISETLGALNTVGHFIVDMTRGQDPSDSIKDDNAQTVPDAILTLTKNVLGQNVTKTIEPLIKRVSQDDETSANNIKQKKKRNKHNIPSVRPSVVSSKPLITTTTTTTTAATVAERPVPSSSAIDPIPVGVSEVSGKEGENRCVTPDGSPGRCDDLSSCPTLLLDISNLRESLCFKSLFVPGVCCPTSPNIVQNPQRPTILRPTSRPTRKPSQSLILLPQITPAPSPNPDVHVSSPISGPNSNDIDEPTPNVVDPEDCGQQEYSAGRIVGGFVSPNGQWPWMAAIFLHGPKRTEFWCGGSLIGTKYILTAAHCTRDSRQKPFAARQFTVRLGDIDLSIDNEPSAPVTFHVREVIAHERFSRVGFYNDLAILVLDKLVKKSKYVIPLCLPRPGLAPPKERLVGRRATVVGWGTTYYGGKESTVQRQADLPIWRNEDCDRSYFQPITDNFLCAGFTEGGVDACQGDSGGPLMMRMDTRWTQIGIVSFGNKCGEPGYPGVYTRLTEYMDWIREHTRD